MSESHEDLVDKLGLGPGRRAEDFLFFAKKKIATLDERLRERAAVLLVQECAKVLSSHLSKIAGANHEVFEFEAVTGNKLLEDDLARATRLFKEFELAAKMVMDAKTNQSL